MKILIFSTAYLPFIGGAELAIKEITDRLPEHQFALITARFSRALPRHEKMGNVDVYRVGFGFWFDKWLLPFLGFRLAKRLANCNSQTNSAVSLTVANQKKGGCDVVWSMMASQASIAAARFKKAHPDKKLVLTLQEGDEEEHLKRYVFGNDFLYRLLIRPWHLLVFKRADGITAISKHLANRAREHSSAPVTVIPNGVDVERFKIKDLRFKEALKKKLGFGEQDKIIVTASRLVTKNAVGDIIEALTYLPEHVKLLILGSGPLEKSYKLKAKSYKLDTRVKFVGEVPHAELPKYLWISDIFCRPSRSEGMGSSFVEAMAAGLPVVATPVGGIVDFLRSPSPPFQGGDLRGGSLSDEWNDKITGLFCKVGDPKSIAEKVKRLLSDDELRNRIIKNASEMVRQKYEWKGIVEKMQSVFSSDAIL